MVRRAIAQIDGALAVELTLEDGQFQFDTPHPSDGSMDGRHAVRITVFDDATILHARELEFDLDTQGPRIASQFPEVFRRTFDEFFLAFDEDNPLPAETFPPESFLLAVRGGVNDGQAVPFTANSTSDANVARIDLPQTFADQSYRLIVSTQLTDLAGNPLVGSGVLDFSVADPTGITQISPTNGEELASVLREAIVRFDEPIQTATVDSQSLRVTALGQDVSGRIVVSSTERFTTVFFDEALPPSTELKVIVDGDKILGRDGLPLDANGDDPPGGVSTTRFRTLPLARIPNTSLFGYVYDAINFIPQESLPIPVPAGDSQFDPQNTGDRSIPFVRATVVPGAGTSTANPRQFQNEVTSFIDASTVYGSDEGRALALATSNLWTSGLAGWRRIMLQERP